MEQKINYEAFGVKKGTKGLVLASSIIEVIIGVLVLLSAVVVLCLGVMFLAMGEAWAQSIFDSLGVYGVIGAVTGAVLAIGCVIAFGLLLAVGLLMTISGSKCLKASGNPITLINARGRILGYGIFYAVLAGLSIIGSFTNGESVSLVSAILSNALLVTLAVLKIVAGSMLPKNSLIAGPQGINAQVPPQYYPQQPAPVQAQPQIKEVAPAPAVTKPATSKGTTKTSTKKATPTKTITKTTTKKPVTKSTSKSTKK